MTILEDARTTEMGLLDTGIVEPQEPLNEFKSEGSEDSQESDEEQEDYGEDDEESDVKNKNVRKQSDIEEATAEATGVDEAIVKLVINAAWDAICRELEDGNSVKLHGKGRFYLSKRSARIGRNPQTRREYDVPAREAMAFQTSPALSKRIREHRELVNRQEAANKEVSEPAK